MSHIFISYSRRDIDFAQKIVDALAANNLDTWIDWKSIPKGEDWEQEIYRGIEEADAFLFLISPDSVASEMCNREIDHALKNGKRILPIVIRDAKNIHPEISKRNWIFCRAGQDAFEQAIAETRETIHIDYEWLNYHTKLQVMALDWKRNTSHANLLRGKSLDDAERRLLTTQADPQPTNLQRDFVFESRKSDERNRKRTVYGLTFMLALISAVAIFATFQWQRAEQQTKIRLAKQLASQAQLTASQSTEGSLVPILLSMESFLLEPSLDAGQTLRSGLHVRPYLVFKTFFTGEIKSIDIATNNALLVIGSEDTYAKVWDINSGKEISSLNHIGGVNFVEFSFDEKSILSGDYSGSLQLWDAATGKTINQMHHGKAIPYNDSTPFADYIVDQGILHATFSPDGKYVASAGSDGTARIWETNTGKEISRVQHDSWTFYVMFSPNGDIAASQGYDNLLVWDIKTNELLGDIRTHLGTFSPDWKYLVTSLDQTTIQIWEVDTGNMLYSLENLTAFKFSSDAKFLATGQKEENTNILRVWDIATGAKLNEFAHREEIDMILISSDSSLVVANDGFSAHVWNIESGDELAFVQHDTDITSFQFSDDNRLLATGDREGSVYLWDITKQNELYIKQTGAVRLTTFSPNGRYAASVSEDRSVKIFDIEKQQDVFQIRSDQAIYDLVFNPDNLTFFLSKGNEIEIWHINPWKKVSALSHPNGAYSIDITSDGKWLLSGGKDGIVRLWNMVDHTEFKNHQFPETVYEVMFSSDNYRFAVNNSQAVSVWDLSFDKALIEFLWDAGSKRMALSPDGQFLAYTDDNDLIVVNVRTKKEVIREKDAGLVEKIVFSPQGKWLAVSHGTVVVWNTENWRQVAELNFSDPVNSILFPTYSLVFSSDNKWLLVSGADNTVRVWNTSFWKQVSQINHNEAVFTTAFSPDQKWILSGSFDGMTKLSLWRPVDLIGETCYRTYRNLSFGEWQRFVGSDIPYHVTCDPETYPLVTIPEDAQSYLDKK